MYFFKHGRTIPYYPLFNETNTLVFNFHTFLLQGYNRKLSAKTERVQEILLKPSLTQLIPLRVSKTQIT